MNTNDESPLVKEKTTSLSQTIDSIVRLLEKDRIFIPDYQRDAEQWDERKKSLFIESLLNNLTIPALFFYEDENNRYEVVDGQQRLNAIRDFSQGKLIISDDDGIDYLFPQSVHYKGKTYDKLPKKLQDTFDDYPLTVIYLPKSIEPGVKLEVFRRINEGGTPLTGQDIRLAYYGQSKSVTLIRLAGVHNEDSKKRMSSLAKEKGVDYPWDKFPKTKELWSQWWEGKDKAKGQTPSLMFLWYIACLDRDNLNGILKDTAYLKMRFRGTIEESLDIYCAQLQYQDSPDGKEVVSSFEELTKCFDHFAEWMGHILSSKLTGISVDKYKQLALFIAAAVELKLSPDKLSDDQWNLAGQFIRTPRKTAGLIFGDEDTYPEPKGRWSGKSGQLAQFDKVIEIVKKITAGKIAEGKIAEKPISKKKPTKSK